MASNDFNKRLTYLLRSRLTAALTALVSGGGARDRDRDGVGGEAEVVE